MIRAKIVGVGAYAPERVLTNAELEKMVETSDEWIMQRTGIRERRIINQQIIAYERQARNALMRENRQGIHDRVARAFGQLLRGESSGAA